MHNNNENICRICGYKNEAIRWESYEGILYPNYIICECCGAESGLEDSWMEGIKTYRKKWLDKGANWVYPKSRPEQWNLEKQFEQIPEIYR